MGMSLQSVAARKTEDVPGKIAEDQVGADRSDGIKPGFAEFAFDIIFFGKAKAARPYFSRVFIMYIAARNHALVSASTNSRGYALSLSFARQYSPGNSAHNACTARRISIISRLSGILLFPLSLCSGHLPSVSGKSGHFDIIALPAHHKMQSFATDCWRKAPEGKMCQCIIAIFPSRQIQ